MKRVGRVFVGLNQPSLAWTKGQAAPLLYGNLHLWQGKMSKVCFWDL